MKIEDNRCAGLFGVMPSTGGDQLQEENQLTSKFSRAALIAGLAIGASGLVAVPAGAATNGVSTANYYVNNPAIGAATNVMPESATVSASIDTGGSPESLLPIPGAGLTWSATADLAIAAGEKWNDGTSTTDAATGNFVPIDGIPVSGSTSNVSATITDGAISNGGISDPGIGAQSGVAQPVSNAGADNYSDVTFEYDPVSDYDVADGQPGVQVNSAQDIQVPTAAGLSDVHTTIGAFGQAAQNATGNSPLKPGTKYYYWIIQEPGATTAASNIDVAAWTGNTSTSNGVTSPANNSYKCYPNAAIAADPTLKSYTNPGAVVNYGGTSLAADQGPCIYYYGNTGGALYYQSPNGTFTTPKLGAVKIVAKAAVKGKVVALGLVNASTYKAAGTIDLTLGKKLVGTARFNIGPKGKGLALVKLTAAGKVALAKGAKVKVAPVSQTANVASVSKWDQRLVGKSVKL